MKRGILAALITCAGLSGACSDTEVQTGIAGLSGTYDLTLVNDLVFVTSADQDELRVLDLSANPKQFIPAPNPLEALAIPVLDRPDSLTRDVGYDAEGDDVAGPYVYARSSGASRISVVAAERERLKQVALLDTASLVTAFAARSPGDVAGKTTSTLYYAIQDPDIALGTDTGGARIIRQELPGPDQGVGDATTRPAPEAVFCLEPGESVQSMTVMREPGQLAIATRRASGRSGRTLLITDAGPLATCTQPTAPTADLSAGFNNVPVRFLTTHPRAQVSSTETLAASRYVFGILDETSCGGTRACSGVLAVDTASSPPGQTARDISGAPMLPIFPDRGLPTGLALVPDARLRVRLSVGEDIVGVPLLGIMPSSGGTITLFSGNDLRQFDLDVPNTTLPAGQQGGGPAFTVVLRNRNEVSTGLTGEPLTALISQVEVTQNPARNGVFYEGSVPTSLYRLVYQGALPGLVSLSRDPENPRRFEAEAASAGLARAGDFIVLENVDTECATALTVAAVEPVTGTSRVRFVLNESEPVPPECTSLSQFTVRAGGSQPFVLLDSSDTFLSRDVVGTGSYSTPTDYFFHPRDFYTDDDGRPETPKVPDLINYPQPPPPLLIRVRSVGPELQRGDRYVVSLTSGIRTYVFGVSNATAGAGLGFYTLPGAVAASRSGGTGLAYIAYPSADGVLQVNLQELVDNANNSRGLTPFE